MYRGFTLDDFMNQCTSNQHDLGKGRQMPVHYGSRALNFQTISSPLGTQIPQATGSAYAQKLAGLKNCTVVYFGDGAASEGTSLAAYLYSTNRAQVTSTPPSTLPRHWRPRPSSSAATIAGQSAHQCANSTAVTALQHAASVTASEPFASMAMTCLLSTTPLSALVNMR